jgi:hypothetical protein
MALYGRGAAWAWHSISQLTWAIEGCSASSGCYVFTKVVNKQAAAFWDVCSDDDKEINYT